MVAKVLPDPEKAYPTSDDAVFFHREITKATTYAYNLCHKLSTNLSNGLILNSPVATTGTDTVNPDSSFSILNTGGYAYGFYVRNLGGHYKHSLDVIDNNIETLIIELFLKEWWLKCAIAEAYKVSVSDVAMFTATLNSSTYALYKPTFSIAPSWSEADVTITVTDTETIETDTTGTDSTGTTTTQTPEVLYFETFSAFPSTGTVDIIYVDRSTNSMYDWNGYAYQVYGGTAGEYSVLYVEENSKFVVHGLGKMAPHVEGTDSDGNTFEPVWVPTDVNSGTASWNTAGSGILRFN
jgi:hypothetical protein